MNPYINKPNHKQPIMFYVSELLWFFLLFFIFLHSLVGQQFGHIVDVFLVLIAVGVREGAGAVVLLLLCLGRNSRRLGRKLVWPMFMTLLGTSNKYL
jgi:hypothetical protein